MARDIIAHGVADGVTMDVMTACNGMLYEISQNWENTLPVLLPLTSLFPLVVGDQASSVFTALGSNRQQEMLHDGVYVKQAIIVTIGKNWTLGRKTLLSI